MHYLVSVKFRDATEMWLINNFPFFVSKNCALVVQQPTPTQFCCDSAPLLFTIDLKLAPYINVKKEEALKSSHHLRLTEQPSVSSLAQFGCMLSLLIHVLHIFLTSLGNSTVREVPLFSSPPYVILKEMR